MQDNKSHMRQRSQDKTHMRQRSRGGGASTVSGVSSKQIYGLAGVMVLSVITLMMYYGSEIQREPNSLRLEDRKGDLDVMFDVEWDLTLPPERLYQEMRKVPIDLEAAPFNSVKLAKNGAVLGEDFAGEVGAERVVLTESRQSLWGRITGAVYAPKLSPECRMELSLEVGGNSEIQTKVWNLKSKIPKGRTFNDYSRMHEQMKVDVARYNKGAMHCDLVRRVRCAVGSSVVEEHLPAPPGHARVTSPHMLTNQDDPLDYAEFPAPQRVVGSQGEVRGRALVLYNMHGWGNSSEKVANEWGNFAHFLNVGYFPGPTELFDGVDYVFMRRRVGISEVTMCAQRKNVKFVWVPTGPCDLCAHAKVLAYLGYKPEYSDASSPSLKNSWATARPWLYKSIVLMNSGVRGPFHGESTNSPWIDVVSMAGRRSRPLFLKDDRSFKTVYAPVVSWEKKVHVQSYFLTTPLSALSGLYEKYLKGCKGSMWDCIVAGELETLDILLQGNFTVYSSLQDHTFQKGQDLKKLRFELDLANNSKPLSTSHNPSYEFNDPCRGIFVKFGGKAVREKLINKMTLKAGFQLTSFMERHPWARQLDINEVYQAGDGAGSKCSIFVDPTPVTPAPTRAPTPVPEPTDVPTTAVPTEDATSAPEGSTRKETESGAEGVKREVNVVEGDAEGGAR